MLFVIRLENNVTKELLTTIQYLRSVEIMKKEQTRELLEDYINFHVKCGDLNPKEEAEMRRTAEINTEGVIE